MVEPLRQGLPPLPYGSALPVGRRGMWYPLAAMKGVLEALHQGDYDTAIDLLTRKALFGREREAKEAWLLSLIHI